VEIVSLSSSVSIVTKLRAAQLTFDSRQELGYFLLATASRTSLGPTQNTIQLVPVFSPRVKRSGRETDRSPLSSAEVKNMWSYTSPSQYVFMAWCLIKKEIRLQSVVLS
jgi:hypothetical protein